ncbi:MAG: NAD(+)/NADH kinase, partial [Polyangiaceae bacterium]
MSGNGKKKPRILVVIKRTSYGTFVVEGKDARVKRLIESGDPTVKRMRRSHESHVETVRELDSALGTLGLAFVKQVGSRTPIDGTYDLVITVGGDGTLLGTSHQLDGST